MKAGSSWVDPVVEELIPHTYASGADGPTIPIYYRAPSTATKEHPVPTILLLTGLDGHRPDNTQRTYEFLKRGWACVIAEIRQTVQLILRTPIVPIGCGIVCSSGWTSSVSLQWNV